MTDRTPRRPRTSRATDAEPRITGIAAQSEPVVAAPLDAGAAPATASRGRDADRSREAILVAARDEFAAYGLGGGRVDRIAERAGINKKLIYYYFKNKEQLFLEVLEESYLRIREAERELHLSDLPPDLAVRKLVEFTWHYFLAHPEFLTLLNSENLYKARHVQQSDRAKSLNSPLIVELGAILERGRVQGIFRGGADPLQLYISIAGVCYFYLSNQHTLTAIFGRDLKSPKALNERLTHVCDVILGYLLRG